MAAVLKTISKEDGPSGTLRGAAAYGVQTGGCVVAEEGCGSPIKLRFVTGSSLRGGTRRPMPVLGERECLPMARSLGALLASAGFYNWSQSTATAHF